MIGQGSPLTRSDHSRGLVCPQLLFEQRDHIEQAPCGQLHEIEAKVGILEKQLVYLIVVDQNITLVDAL